MKRIVALTLALIMVFSLVACAAKEEVTSAPVEKADTSAKPEAPTEEAPAEEDSIMIGFSLPSNQEERWTMDTAAIQGRCDELGYELTYAAADNDANKQYDQCMTMLTKGADVLIVAAIDSSAAAAIVEEAVKVGVPVLAYDRLITNTENLSAYITFDSILTGEKQGQYIVDQLKAKYGKVAGNIVLLRGSPTDVCSALYFQGAMNILGEYIDSGALNVVLEGDCIDWKPEDATKHMENAISIAAGQGIEIDAVLAPNDGTANGCIAAMGDDAARNMIMTGLDADLSACQRIVAGLQSSTIWGDTRELGRTAVDSATELLKTGKVTGNGVCASTNANGDPIEVTEVRVNITLLDKNNINEIVESGYYTHEEVYGK